MAASLAQVIGFTHSPESADADAGRYRLVLHRGQASGFHDVPRWTNRGVFSVRGDVVRFTWGDGVAVYRWNVYRDTLTLRYPEGRETGPPNPTFAPWYRVGG